jgi:tRNA dimethylallyltransferase
MPPTVIAIFGPTGIGKTAVTLALARLLRAAGEDPIAISADALQVYRGLETLTGAADATEQAELEHRLLSFLPVGETFSAGQYAALAHREVDAALDAGRTPIVVGGTGLYLRAALTDLDLKPPPAEGARERWLAELELVGAPALHARLRERAPWVAATIEPGDRQRIVRAHELLDAGALTPPPAPETALAAPAPAAAPAAPQLSQLWTADTRRPTLLAGLTMERSALYARIDARVDAMLAAGVREEVERAVAAGASATARKALGFDDLLAGDVEGMKRRTRNYARRQLTWMRKLAGVETIDVTGRSAAEVAEEIANLRRRQPPVPDRPDPSQTPEAA